MRVASRSSSLWVLPARRSAVLIRPFRLLTFRIVASLAAINEGLPISISSIRVRPPLPSLSVFCAAQRAFAISIPACKTSISVSGTKVLPFVRASSSRSAAVSNSRRFRLPCVTF